jgi:hypothetical protein
MLYVPEKNVVITPCLDSPYLKRTQPCILAYFLISKGAHGSVVVKALCYKLEGRGFKT